MMAIKYLQLQVIHKLSFQNAEFQEKMREQINEGNTHMHHNMLIIFRHSRTNTDRFTSLFGDLLRHALKRTQISKWAGFLPI